ncbi:MAG: valine--tRNA ligase [Candidatus Binatia bacterium]
MSGYDPKSFESRWYQRWTESGAFAPPPPREGERTFSIVIPPPNVTGSLHMGHALNNTLQDVLVRYHRMLGEAALWVPGTDHAGIATQNVVERQLLAEGTDRHALGREAFVERTWKWKAQSGGVIFEQLRRLGVSCDWSRERFTMDEGLSRAVREVFVTLFEQGLIRRDRYLINWCPRCRTALSDIEVEHEERAGSLWHLRYPLEGGGHLSVATTRPETMLGDTAVAVHPDDERYKALVGSKVVLPVTGRAVPVIADAYVESSFGSGAVKITPAHDPNDFEMGLRHGLAMISVMNEDGTMSDEAGPYAGLTIAECRAVLVERFAAEGLLEKVEDHRNAVGLCYRCRNVVEPLLSDQWFLQVRELADATLVALDEGRTRFVPAHWEKTYRAWMENIRPWCISRQLWWGHRIPAWYCDGCGELSVSREDLTACPKCRGPVRQDEDVLDTWFSSGLWPFSTMGWPEKTSDLARFYPTTALVTGFDIIFFWVARMMMMGIHFMGEVPFRDIYIHALVRDEHGQKMSKSKGNVIDPLVIVDEYGADAFRFTLVAFAAMGRDVRLAEDRIAGYRNFVNKLWNAARFSAMKREGTATSCAMPESPRLVPNRWIRSRLAATIEETRSALDEYRFNEAAQALYRFTWNEFCDWYIEISKVLLDGGEEDRAETLATLTATLETLMRLLHPLVPFVTEEIWQELPSEGRAEGMLITGTYPELRPDWRDAAVDAAVDTLIEVVRSVRNIRSEMRIAPKVELDLWVGDGETAAIVAANEGMVRRLARLAAVTIGGAAPAGSATAVVGGAEIAVPIAAHVDLVAETERLRREIERAGQEAARAAGKLANEAFVARAKEEVVEGERAKLAAAEQEAGALRAAMARIQAIGTAG